MDRKTGIIGVLSMIVAALGGTMYLTPDEFANSYVCTTNQNVGIFDHLSATYKTGYYNDSGIMKSKLCSDGWQKLRQYAAENDIEINTLLANVNVPETTSQKNVVAYICGPRFLNEPCEVI